MRAKSVTRQRAPLRPISALRRLLDSLIIIPHPAENDWPHSPTDVFYGHEGPDMFLIILSS